MLCAERVPFPPGEFFTAACEQASVSAFELQDAERVELADACVFGVVRTGEVHVKPGERVACERRKFFKFVDACGDWLPLVGDGGVVLFAVDVAEVGGGILRAGRMARDRCRS